MENESKIAFLKALNKVQGTLGSAKTDSENPHFKSRYASLSSVNDAVMGPLAEAGFVLLQGGVDIGGKHYLRTTLYHVGGHSESFDYPLIEKTENPQHIASSVTYARRYSICALLNLNVEDDDGNAATPTKAAPTKAATPERQTQDSLPGGPTISPAQGKRFYAIAMGSGKTNDDINSYLVKNFNTKRSENIPRAKYEEAVAWAEAPKSEAQVEEVPF